MPRERGRFAPSPSGPLHCGSLIAALASFLAVRSRGGEWLVRIEDLDKPREMPGAAADILYTLERLGLTWDGPVLYQSRRGERYDAALERLRAWLYPCACSRREIARHATAGVDGPVYPGLCRHVPFPTKGPATLRVRTDDQPITFQDGVYGPCTQRLESQIGDFVVRRADGLFAYQLAVVVDDAEQGVTQVVRGSDLLSSTPRQIYLQRLLGFPTPAYTHLPVVMDRHGQKLSKQTGAAPLDLRRPAAMLIHALEFLGQRPPPALARAKAATVLTWALEQWRPARIPALPGQSWPASSDPEAVHRPEKYTDVYSG
jgi:glutamyl-Q tRNA(Asp) synthetase